MLKICVIFGGVSAEHEVSLRSAVNVISNLDRSRYEVTMLGITKAGAWRHYCGPVDLIAGGQWEHSHLSRPAVFSLERGRPGLILIDGEKPCASVAIRRRLLGEEPPRRTKQEFIPLDVVFPVLHGKNGEDGTVQGLLELAGIPYVGSGVLSSAACMDKEVTHIILQNAGVPKTKIITIRADDLKRFGTTATMLKTELGYPMFVKPASGGSSVGISKVQKRQELRAAIEAALLHDEKVLVEQVVEGAEVECAVLGNSKASAARVLGEIAPSRDFYDYTGKYLDDSTALHIPARISKESAKQVKELAVKAYLALGCKGMARVDFFVRPDGSPILNEVNTIPGFTEISMYPRLFIKSGVTYSKLLDKLIELALEST